MSDHEMLDYDDSRNAIASSSSNAAITLYNRCPATSIFDGNFAANEDIESTERLVLQILKQDHDAFLEQQKGKGRAGDVTDAGMSLELWEKEVRDADQAIDDRKLAISIANAVASDQQTILTLQDEERVAQNDRALALKLSGRTAGNAANNAIPELRVDSADPNTEYLCAAMSDYDALESTHRSAEIESSVATSSKAKGPKIEQCDICGDKLLAEPLFRLNCNHVWCNSCLRHSFRAATREEELMPPRCCSNEFPTNLAIHLLEYQELADFCIAKVEFVTRNRLYCADPACSKFIPPWKIKDEKGECPECHKYSHTTCRALWESNHICPSDEALQQVLELAKQQGWSRCPNCQAMVELNRGCNHITCKCSQEFCYECGAKWRTCTCPLWHEYRLMDMARRVAVNEVGNRAGAAAETAAAVNRAAQNLRDHEDTPCQHHRPSQWRGTCSAESLECEICNNVMSYFISICKRCQMQACLNCRKTRLR